MFEFRVNDNMPGETIKFDDPGEVRVVARVRSQYPLNRVEIIYNGEVIAEVKIDGEGLDVRIDEKLSIPRSGWIALRSSGPPQADQPTGTVFGHTSPVYVEVAGHPIDARKDAEYFIGWIERLRTDIRRRNRVPTRQQVHVESQISQAREVFNKLVGRDKKSNQKLRTD